MCVDRLYVFSANKCFSVIAHACLPFAFFAIKYCYRSPSIWITVLFPVRSTSCTLYIFQPTLFFLWGCGFFFMSWTYFSAEPAEKTLNLSSLLVIQCTIVWAQAMHIRIGWGGIYHVGGQHLRLIRLHLPIFDVLLEYLGTRPVRWFARRGAVTNGT